MYLGSTRSSVYSVVCTTSGQLNISNPASIGHQVANDRESPRDCRVYGQGPLPHKWFLNYLPSWPTSNVTEIGSAAMTFRADTRGPDSTPATAARFEASPRPGSCNQMWCTRHERGSCGRRPCSACKSSAHAALWPLTSANHRGSESFTRMLLTAAPDA